MYSSHISTHISFLDDIAQLTVETRPTVRLRSLISLQVTVLNGDTTAYRGPISFIVETLNGTQLVQLQSILIETSDIQLLFKSDSFNKGVMRIVLEASNDISEHKEQLTVIVVGMLGRLYYCMSQ